MSDDRKRSLLESVEELRRVRVREERETSDGGSTGRSDSNDNAPPPTNNAVA